MYSSAFHSSGAVASFPTTEHIVFSDLKDTHMFWMSKGDQLFRNDIFSMSFTFMRWDLTNSVSINWNASMCRRLSFMAALVLNGLSNRDLKYLFPMLVVQLLSKLSTLTSPVVMFSWSKALYDTSIVFFVFIFFGVRIELVKLSL